MQAISASGSSHRGYPPPRQARYAMLVLTLLGFLFTMDITLTALLVEPMKRDLNLTDVQVALLQGTAYGLALGLGALPMGRLIDRYSRRSLIAIGLGCWSIALCGVALSSSVAALVIARAALGLVVALIVPATFSMAADIYPVERRSVATSLLVVGQALGQGFGVLAGGKAFDALTNAEHTPFGLAPWRELFVAPALLAMVLLLMLLPLREPARHEVKEAHANLRVAIGELWSFSGILVPLTLALLFAQVTIQAASIWASPLLIRRGLTPGEFAGWMSTVLFAGGIFGALASGQMSEFSRRRNGPRGVLLPGLFCALVMAPASLFAVASSLTAFAVLLTVNIFAGAVVATVGAIAIALLIPNEVRGLALGATSVVSAVFGIAGAPAAIAALSERMGGESHLGTAFVVVCIPSALLAAICLWLAARSSDQGLPVLAEANSP